jgi:hypothetical protein
MPKVRTTLTIDRDVLSRYQAMASLQGESLSSTVSQWLEVSADSAHFLAQQVAKVKRSPRPNEAAVRLAETFNVMEEGYRQSAQAGKGGPPAAGARGEVRAPANAAGGLTPPSCNTGGKVPKTHKRASA